MNVCYVTTRYPPNAGGVEAHVAELATRLAAAGHDVTVLTADAEGLTRSTEYRDGVCVIRHPNVAPGGAFHVAPGILTTVRRITDDVGLVHAHNYHSLPLLLAALGTGAETPFVATTHYHGGSASDLRDKLLSAYRFPGGWALRRADARIAVSGWERRQIEADFGVEATVIPNGLDVARFAEASPNPGWSDCDYLLSVGRLEKYKGVQYVIRALPDLDYDLAVAGSGDYGSELKRLAREVGVEDRVHFLGFVADEELPGLYAGAAAFVTMSEFEAYGMTVAEALAAGTPCVVRNAGALVDWADRADCVGVDPAALVSGVGHAVDLDAPAEPLPTWGDVVEQTAAVYDSVCRGGWC